MNKTNLEKNLQQPRRLGTVENETTQALLEKTLTDRGLKAQSQNFFYEPVFNFSIVMKIFLLAIYSWGLFNVFLIQIFNTQFIWSYFFWMLATILIYLVRTSFYNDFESLVIKKALRIPSDDKERQKYTNYGLKSAKNLYFIKESIEKANNIIILGANIDSASITMNKLMEKLNKIEVLLVPAMGSLSLIYFLLIEFSFNLAFIITFRILLFILLFFLFLNTILNFFEIKQNRSPGAVNNGSSVIALLRLIDNIKEIDFKNTIVIIAFFNGKEENMIGSTAFAEYELPKLLEQYKIKKRNVSVITLESVGAIKKQLYLRERFSLLVPFFYHQNLKFYLKNFGIFYDFVLKEQFFSNRNSDHIPFMIRNYKAVNVFRNFSEAHTKHDTDDKISEENIETIVTFLKKFIEAKDEDLKFEVY